MQILVHNPVHNLNRSLLLKLVIDLVAIRSHATRDDMDMVVVRVMMAVDEHWLPIHVIAHLMEVLVSYLHQFRKRILSSLARNRHMELRIPDVRVASGAGGTLVLQVLRGYFSR